MKPIESNFDNRLIPITKHVRAGQNGKRIICPNCGGGLKVYHFSWAAVRCAPCGTMVDKLQWLAP